MKECEICSKVPGEQHHIVFRSQCKAMIKAPINHIYLCEEHHRGNNGPHLNRKTDIKYKLELQKKLFELFIEKHYHKYEVEQLLRIDSKEVDRLVKTLKWYKEGYDRIDIVRMCMGGMLYGK